MIYSRTSIKLQLAKGKVWGEAEACTLHSSSLRTRPESKRQHRTLMKNTFLCLAQRKQPEKFKISPDPTQLAPSTGSGRRSQVFGRISAPLWPRSASDWGVLAACARSTPKPRDARVHRIPLCIFGHGTFTSITFLHDSEGSDSTLL